MNGGNPPEFKLEKYRVDSSRVRVCWLMGGVLGHPQIVYAMFLVRVEVGTGRIGIFSSAFAVSGSMVTVAFNASRASMIAMHRVAIWQRWHFAGFNNDVGKLHTIQTSTQTFFCLKSGRDGSGFMIETFTSKWNVTNSSHEHACSKCLTSS